MLFADIAADSGSRLVTTLIVAAITTPISYLFGRYVGLYRARRKWKRKDLLNRLTVSLNILSQGHLKLRTIFDRPFDQIFPNEAVADGVLKAASQCTADNPVVAVAKEDRWFVLNFVLNAIAEVFAHGSLKQDIGGSVQCVRYGLFLTCEVLDQERLRKVRAMLIRLEDLEQFPIPLGEMPALESPLHADRVITLRKAAELYHKEPDLFLTIDLCV